MVGDENDRASSTLRAEGETIDATFRSGSLTAISVVVGFSLSFLTRWAALPGPWLTDDLVALSAAILGIAFQITALASLLSTQSLLLRNYNRAVRLFLIGLVSVASGVALVIAGDLVGCGKRLLGERMIADRQPPRFQRQGFFLACPGVAVSKHCRHPAWLKEVGSRGALPILPGRHLALS